MITSRAASTRAGGAAGLGLHTIEFDVDPGAYDAMIQTYIDTGGGRPSDQATSDLTEALFISGLADEIVNDWTFMLHTEATAFVDASTVDTNAVAITAEFPT